MLQALGNIWVPYNYTPTGAPISRGQSNTVRDHADFEVYRTPLVNGLENEPGAAWPGGPYYFTPNGVKMGPGSGLGCSDCAKKRAQMLGASDALHINLQRVTSIGPTVTAVVGGAAGAMLAPEHRVMGLVIGALAGGILGVIFSPG